MFEAMFKDSLPAQPSRIQMKPPPFPVSSRVSPENTLLPLGSSSPCSPSHVYAETLEQFPRECVGSHKYEKVFPTLMECRVDDSISHMVKGPGSNMKLKLIVFSHVPLDLTSF